MESMYVDRTYMGFDYGTSNVAAAMIYVPRGGRGVGNTKTDILKLDPGSDPYVIHCKVADFIDDFVEDGYSYLKGAYFAFIESAFKGPNARTYQRMTRVGHSVYLITSELGMNVSYIDNNTWRKVLFDKGNTKKDVCQDWAYDRWPFLLEYKKSERGHRADAMMIAEAGRRLKENEIEGEILRP